MISTGQSGAHAVGVNLTIDRTAGPGFVTAWATGPVPNTSVVNADEAGATVANYFVVPVEADGTFLLYTSVTTDVIVDLMTRFTSSASAAGFQARRSRRPRVRRVNPVILGRRVIRVPGAAGCAGFGGSAR